MESSFGTNVPFESFLDIELLRLELQNYGGAIVMEVLRIYLQEIYDHRPVLECSELRARLSTSIRTHTKGLLRCHNSRT